ncbi:hypothetical protein STEG23_035919 [Scotinomys teguina]
MACDEALCDSSLHAPVLTDQDFTDIHSLGSEEGYQCCQTTGVIGKAAGRSSVLGPYTMPDASCNEKFTHVILKTGIKGGNTEGGEEGAIEEVTKKQVWEKQPSQTGTLTLTVNHALCPDFRLQQYTYRFFGGISNSEPSLKSPPASWL